MAPDPIPRREVTTHYRVKDIADDLSEMTLVHDEAEPEKTARRPRRRRKVGRSFVMVDTVSLGELDLSRVEYRVFSTLMSLVDKDRGEIRANNIVIAERAEMHASAVSPALQSLLRRRIIFKEGYGVYRVNPWIAYIGDWKDWDPTAAKTEEPVWSTHSA